MKLFVRGDVDGFFGLFIDNLLQLMLINVLCVYVCNLPVELVTQRILPAAALSILLGNVFYTWQAWQLMKRTGRNDVTALPYGINTPSLIAFVFLVIAPVYSATNDADLAWRVGLFACLCSGIMETGGAFIGDWLRRHTPRAALLSALAGIAITFISMNFIFQLFAMPGVAVLPLLVILIVYGARVKLPLGLPGGFVAVAIGVAIAWGMIAFGQPLWEPPGDAYTFAVYAPIPVIGPLLSLLREPIAWQFMAVIVPMGVFNIIGSLQNLESAEAAGDRFETKPSLLVNGIGTIAAACFGSPFPTTIYIGHPGWKAMGARAGYSIVNGIVITALCLIGGVTLVLEYVPLEATLGILLWIGIIITAQAFEAAPTRHALAVAIGLIPAFAAWALEILIKPLAPMGDLAAAGESLSGAGVYIGGIIALSQGFIITSMIYAAFMAHVVDRAFRKAAIWLVAAAALSAIGLMHAYHLDDGGQLHNVFVGSMVDGERVWLAAPDFTLMYLLGAGLLMWLHVREGHDSAATDAASSSST